jgi:hypothetical protein
VVYQAMSAMVYGFCVWQSHFLADASSARPFRGCGVSGFFGFLWGVFGQNRLSRG